MFKKIGLVSDSLHHYNDYGAACYRSIWNIHDTCFTQTTTIIGPSLDIHEPVALFKTYLERKLSIAKNIGIYYVSMADKDLITHDSKEINRLFPHLNSKNYYPAINQFTIELNNYIKHLPKSS